MSLPTAADIATLIIVFHLLVLLIVPLALSIVTARAMFLLNRKVKQVMPAVQGYSRQLANNTEKISQRAAEPFIRMEAGSARRQAMRDHLFGSLRGALRK